MLQLLQWLYGHMSRDCHSVKTAILVEEGDLADVDAVVEDINLMKFRIVE